MEQNFAGFLSTLAHGNNPFVVYNDENSYGELTIYVVVKGGNEYGDDLQSIIIHKWMSIYDPDTDVNAMQYKGQTVKIAQNYNTLTDVCKGLEGIWDEE